MVKPVSLSSHSLESLESEAAFSEPGRALLLEQLPIEIFLRTVKFLSYEEQGKFAQTARCAADSVHYLNEIIQDSVVGISERVAFLEGQESIDPEQLQQLFVAMIESPAVGHPQYWAPVMNRVMAMVPDAKTRTISGIMQYYELIFEMLGKSGKTFSHRQVEALMQYLGQSMVFFKPWISYRIFERAIETAHFDREVVEAVLRQVLFQIAENKIAVRLHTVMISAELPELAYIKAEIDPRFWFGANGNHYSLWETLDMVADETVYMPSILEEVLWKFFQGLKESCPVLPLQVNMIGRVEAELPLNFTLNLARRITDAEIFLDCLHTVRRSDLINSQYACSIYAYLSADPQRGSDLAQQYPEAVAEDSATELL